MRNLLLIPFPKKLYIQKKDNTYREKIIHLSSCNYYNIQTLSLLNKNFKVLDQKKEFVYNHRIISPLLF